MSEIPQWNITLSPVQYHALLRILEKASAFANVVEFMCADDLYKHFITLGGGEIMLVGKREET